MNPPNRPIRSLPYPMHGLRPFLLLPITLLCLLQPGLSQEPVAELQAEARQRFVELHDRMQRLQTSLAETRPEDSDRLAQGNRFIQERDLREGMAAAQALIEAGHYDEAIARMDVLREQLLGLLDLLLDRASGLRDKLDEVERLEQFQQQVEQLIDEQQREHDASERIAALERHLRELAQAKATAEALRAEQGALRDNHQQQSAEAAAATENRLEERAKRLTDELRAIEAQGQKLVPRSQQDGQGNPSASTAKASAAMGQAGSKLSQAAPADDDMQAAERALDEAIAQIDELSEEARRKLLSLPFEQLAKAQQQTQDDTDRLAAEMEQGEQGQDGEGGGKPTPGRQNLEQAVPEQRAAAGLLRETKPGGAREHQDEALDQLRQAQQQLEEALSQLRQELQEEVLRALEERFITMLGEQRELSKRTRAADKLRSELLTADDNPPAQIQRRASELARGEEALAGEASDALKLLLEDGSSAAFPALVEMLRDDLLELTARLDRARTGAGTQAIQADVEATLEDLIGSLRKEMERRDGQGGGGQCSGKPELLPRSADLKLVMNKQKRVNRRTAAFEGEVPAETRDEPDAAERTRRLAEEQAAVEELLRKIADQINKQGEGNL